MTVPLSIGLDTGFALTPADWRALIPHLEEAAEFVTLTDAFARNGPQGQDALILANWLGAQTSRVGIVAGVALNFAEPFHVSTAIATLDHVTSGRAGLLVQGVEGPERDAVGHGPEYLPADLEDAVEAIRQLWDSWQDDAIIRDRKAHRFLDADRLHHINFKGRSFSISGPSITPRPPQGQPAVFAKTRLKGADFVLGLDWTEVVVDTRTAAASIAALDSRALHLTPRHRKDLPHLLRLVADLREHGAVRDPAMGPLRARLGLPPAPNRFAA